MNKFVQSSIAVDINKLISQYSNEETSTQDIFDCIVEACKDRVKSNLDKPLEIELPEDIKHNAEEHRLWIHEHLTKTIFDQALFAHLTTFLWKIVNKKKWVL